jgi:hypothetical protein
MERERVVSEGEDTDEITTCVSDVRKKATLGGNQRRHCETWVLLGPH